jgi:hypothetical protein
MDGIIRIKSNGDVVVNTLIEIYNWNTISYTINNGTRVVRLKSSLDTNAEVPLCHLNNNDTIYIILYLPSTMQPNPNDWVYELRHTFGTLDVTSRDRGSDAITYTLNDVNLSFYLSTDDNHLYYNIDSDNVALGTVYATYDGSNPKTSNTRIEWNYQTFMYYNTIVYRPNSGWRILDDNHEILANFTIRLLFVYGSYEKEFIYDIGEGKQDEIPIPNIVIDNNNKTINFTSSLHNVVNVYSYKIDNTEETEIPASQDVEIGFDVDKQYLYYARLVIDYNEPIGFGVYVTHRTEPIFICDIENAISINQNDVTGLISITSKYPNVTYKIIRNDEIIKEGLFNIAFSLSKLNNGDIIEASVVSIYEPDETRKVKTVSHTVTKHSSKIIKYGSEDVDLKHTKIYRYVDIIFNDIPELPKSLDSIQYVLNETDAGYKHSSFPLPNSTIFAGDYIEIYSDECDTGELQVFQSNDRKDVNGLMDYKYPHWDKGHWTFNYFRNSIINDVTKKEIEGYIQYVQYDAINRIYKTVKANLADVIQANKTNGDGTFDKSDNRSLVYGKYFVVRFIFRQDRKFKLDNVNVTTNRY